MGEYEEVVCGICGLSAESQQDKMPVGWYILYAYNNDDGNNVPYYEVCSNKCLMVAAAKQRHWIRMENGDIPL